MQANGEPPPEALIKIASTVKKLQKYDQTRSLAIPKALCGKVVNVVIWEDPHWKLITESVPVGCFIRLRHVDVRKWKNNPFRCKYSCEAKAYFCVGKPNRCAFLKQLLWSIPSLGSLHCQMTPSKSNSF
jgi:hypothetical protein